MEYLIHSGTHWEETSLICKRDGEKIYREVFDNGKKTNHFCCARSGCTWTNYDSNIKQLMEESNEQN